MLELKTTIHKDVFDIELNGALDSQSSYDFKSWMIQKNLEGYQVVALNCHKLEYMSSRGIGSLVDIHKIYSSRQAVLVLYHVSNEVLNLLEFLKLTNEIIIMGSIDEVLKKYSGVQKKEAVVGNVSGGGDQSSSAQVQNNEVADSPENVRNVEDDEKEDNIELELDEHLIQGSSTKTSEPEATKSAEPSEQEDVTLASDEAPSSEEYINLSKTPSAVFSGDLVEPVIVYCPNCTQGLRIKQRGQYLCPDCRTKFRYPFDK